MAAPRQFGQIPGAEARLQNGGPGGSKMPGAASCNFSAKLRRREKFSSPYLRPAIGAIYRCFRAQYTLKTGFL